MKKLSLNRETLRSINLGQAATVVGADLTWVPVYTGDTCDCANVPSLPGTVNNCAGTNNTCVPRLCMLN